MGFNEPYYKNIGIHDVSDYSIKLSPFALMNLWSMVILIVFIIGVFYCCHCCYRNKKLDQRLADLEAMEYDLEEYQNETKNQNDIKSENMELKSKNNILQRQLKQSLQQIKEFRGLDHEYSSVINDLEKQLNTMNDNLVHKDQVINALMHKMKIMSSQYDYTHDIEHENTNTSLPNSRLYAHGHGHGINKSHHEHIQSGSGTENGLISSIELSPISDQRVKHNIDRKDQLDTTNTETGTRTTHVRTSLEVNMDGDMDVDDLDIIITPKSNNSEWKGFLADSKEEEKEIVADIDNDVTITMEDQHGTDEVAVVTRKKYEVQRDGNTTAELSYITQTPSRTMSARSMNNWVEENSLEKVPSHHLHRDGSEDSNSNLGTDSQSQKQLEIKLRSYVMKENEWFFEKKKMEQDINALNDELKAVQTELHGFKAYEYSDKQHDLIMGIITNYTK